MRVESTKLNSVPGPKGSFTFIMNLILKPDSDVHLNNPTETRSVEIMTGYFKLKGV